MPSLRKRVLQSGKTVWDIRYYAKGKPQSFHIGETDRRTAEKIFHRFCSRLAENKLDDTGHPCDDQASEQTLSQLAKQAAIFAGSNKSHKTQERESLAFQAMLRVMGDIPISHLTPARLEEYKATRLQKASPSTVNIEIRVLNTAMNQAAALGWLREQPKLLVKQIKLPEPEPLPWLDHEQIAAILSTEDAQFRRFLQFLLYTGCRRNEALALTWQDIDLQKRQAVVRAHVGKMGKRRAIPINDALHEILQAWPEPRDGLLFPAYGPNQVSMKFRRWARQIGMPKGISLHSLRATFGCHLIAKGVDIYTVSQLLGHSSVKVTEKYYLALSPKHVQDAVNQLHFD